MPNPVVKRLGKDIAGKIYRYVHSSKWNKVNEEYTNLLDLINPDGSLVFKAHKHVGVKAKDLDAAIIGYPAFFWFNYRNLSNVTDTDVCSITRWGNFYGTARLPKNY